MHAAALSSVKCHQGWRWSRDGRTLLSVGSSKLAAGCVSDDARFDIFCDLLLREILGDDVKSNTLHSGGAAAGKKDCSYMI